MRRRGTSNARRGHWLLAAIVLFGCHSDPAVTSVGVSAVTTALVPGQSTTLSASVIGSGQFNNTVTWSVDGGGPGLVAQGLGATYTAPSVSATTNVVIRATSTEDGTVSGTVTLTVSMTPVSVMLTPDATRLYSGQAININGTVVGTAGSPTG